MNNREFATKDPLFLKCCERAGVTSTTRQASKFRNNKGKAHKVKLQVSKEVNNAK